MTNQKLLMTIQYIKIGYQAYPLTIIYCIIKFTMQEIFTYLGFYSVYEEKKSDFK